MDECVCVLERYVCGRACLHVCCLYVNMCVCTLFVGECVCLRVNVNVCVLFVCECVCVCLPSHTTCHYFVRVCVHTRDILLDVISD